MPNTQTETGADQMEEDFSSSISTKEIKMKPESCDKSFIKSQDPETMFLQIVSDQMNDAVFPDPEELSFMKNYQSSCPPLIRSFGAYAFGGVSKTLHLTAEVFRERIRSVGDTEVLSPENKYIENNYESMLGMQLVESATAEPFDLPYKYDRSALQDVPDLVQDEAVVKAETPSRPPAVQADPVFVPPPEPASPTPASTPEHDAIDEKDTSESEDQQMDVDEVVITKEIIAEDVPQERVDINPDSISEKSTDDIPKTVKKVTTAMPLSVKITRQVIPEPPLPIMNPSVVYLEFSKTSYVKLVRLTDSEIRRASRKRPLTNPESLITENMVLGDSGKSVASEEAPKKRRTQSTSCQILNSSANLNDDYLDVQDQDCSNLDKCENQQGQESPIENHSESQQSPELLVTTPTSPNKKPKYVDINIFEVTQPKKKPPSNYRLKYEKRPSVNKEEDKPSNSNPPNSASTQLCNGKRGNQSPCDKANSEVKSKEKNQDKFEWSKKTKGKNSTSNSSNDSRDGKFNRSNSVQPYVPKTPREIENERRRLRNRQNLANSTKTGCFQISGDTDPQLKAFRIPKKNEISRKSVNFFEKVDKPQDLNSYLKTQSVYTEKKYRQAKSRQKMAGIHAATIRRNELNQAKQPKSDRNGIGHSATLASRKCFDPNVKKSGLIEDESPEQIPVETHSSSTELRTEDDSSNSSSLSSSSSNHSSRSHSSSAQSDEHQPEHNNNALEIQRMAQTMLTQAAISASCQFGVQMYEETEDIGEVEYGPWEPISRLADPASLQQVLAEDYPQNFYYIPPGPTNESNQVVQVVEDDTTFLGMESGEPTLENIGGEVEVYTSPVDNQIVTCAPTSVITALEPQQQTQSREITTTTICSPQFPKGPQLSDEESGGTPLPAPQLNTNSSENKVADPTRNSWRRSSFTSSTSRSTGSSCSSSCSSCSGTETEDVETE